MAGTGEEGNEAGGIATKIKLKTPIDMVFVGDMLHFTNLGSHRIQRITSENEVITIAGNGQAGSTGDGLTAPEAKVNQPLGLALSPDNSLYFSEYGANKVRKISAMAEVSHVTGAQNGAQSPDVDKLARPRFLTVDAEGNLYISDYNNSRIVMVHNGAPTVLAGTTGVKGSASGELTGPEGLAIGPDGFLYIADAGNHRIMKY